MGFKNGIGVLGGTFDPIHNGHLRLALEMRQMLDLAQVLLIPAANPRLRPRPLASIALRMRMVEAAIEGVRGLAVSSIECQDTAKSTAKSHTFTTLQALQSQYHDQPLYLILGADAFAAFDQWYRYQELLDLSHLAIAQRPHATLPMQGPLAALLDTRGSDDLADLKRAAWGRIMITQVPLLDISATHIRALSAQGQSVRFLVPDPVYAILQQETPYSRSALDGRQKTYQAKP